MNTLEEFDFTFEPSLNEQQMIALSSLHFVGQKENVLMLGSPGVGKPQLAIALTSDCGFRERGEIFSADQVAAAAIDRSSGPSRPHSCHQGRAVPHEG